MQMLHISGEEKMINDGGYMHYFVQFADTTKDIVLGSMGGVAAYMYDYSKKKKENKDVVWSNSAMAINMFLGGFVANAMGSFIPSDLNGRDGIVGFIGVSSYAILGIVESRFAKIIMSKVMK